MKYIYRITNKINGKSYIGQTTKTPEIRFHQHFLKSKKSNTLLSKAIRKYGIENFELEILEKIEDEKISLDEREKYYIKFYETYMNGYNLTEGGNLFDENSNPVYKEECRKKISEKLKQNTYWKSEKFKLQRKIKWTGENNPAKKEINRIKSSIRAKENNVSKRPEVKEKIRQKSIGRIPSDATRKKMSENNGRYWKGRKVPQYIIDAASKGRSLKCSGINNPASKPFKSINVKTKEEKIFGIYREAYNYYKTNDDLKKIISDKYHKEDFSEYWFIKEIKNAIKNNIEFCNCKWERIKKCND